MTSERDEAARAARQSADPASDESLSEALGAVARQLREKSAETLAAWSITPAHLRALRMLNRHGTMRLSTISDRLQIAPRTASGLRGASRATLVSFASIYLTTLAAAI